MNRLSRMSATALVSTALALTPLCAPAVASENQSTKVQQVESRIEGLTLATPAEIESAFTPGEIAKPAAGYGYDLTYRLYPISPWKWDSGNKVFDFIKPALKGLFPIGGMVNNPKVGQKLILTGNNPVKVTSVGSRHFSLYSLPGHLEGAGNTITFTISANGQYLNVRASGPKAAKFPGNIVPSIVWPRFAGAIKQKLYPTGTSTPHSAPIDLR